MVERKRLAIVAALASFPLVLTAMAPGQARAAFAANANPGGRLFEYQAFASQHVVPRKVVVWLPPDYEEAGAPCSVLYMHDGQNLFAPANPMGHGPWDVDRHLLALMALGAARRTLVVGIWNTGLNRAREYGPAAAIERLSPELQALVAGSSASQDHSPLSDQYLRFITDELKPFIDRSFRTRPGPADTFMMGSSMGGLISLYALAARPDVFGGAGCLSTHWPLTTQFGLLMPTLDPRAAKIAAAFLDWLSERLPVAGAHRLYFDRGTANLDGLYGPFQARMDAIAAAKGYREGIDTLSRVFAGEDHNERAWRGRLAIALGFLLRP